MGLILEQPPADKRRASLPFPSAPRVPDSGRCSLQKQRQPELLGASQKPAGPSSPTGLRAQRALGAQRAKLPSTAGGRLVWGAKLQPAGNCLC